METNKQPDIYKLKKKNLIVIIIIWGIKCIPYAKLMYLHGPQFGVLNHVNKRF